MNYLADKVFSRRPRRPRQTPSTQRGSRSRTTDMDDVLREELERIKREKVQAEAEKQPVNDHQPRRKVEI